MSYAEITYNRFDELYAKNAISKDNKDSAESDCDAAIASLLNAEANLITAKDDLKNTKIIAPIADKIGTTSYTKGNFLTPSSGTIASIVQLDPLRVNFTMSNRDFLSLFGNEKGLRQTAEIRLLLANGEFYPLPGLVEYIDNKVNPRTDTLQVYVKFDNPESILIPGSSLQVHLSRKSGKTMPAVEPSAVMHDSKTTYVYVLDANNMVERREVVLGTGNSATQLIQSGLTQGERIVVDGTHKARPGSVVRVKDKS